MPVYGVNEISCAIGTLDVTDKEVSSRLGGVNNKLGLWNRQLYELIMSISEFFFFLSLGILFPFFSDLVSLSYTCKNSNCGEKTGVFLGDRESLVTQTWMLKRFILEIHFMTFCGQLHNIK